MHLMGLHLVRCVVTCEGVSVCCMTARMARPSKGSASPASSAFSDTRSRNRSNSTSNTDCRACPHTNGKGWLRDRPYGCEDLSDCLMIGKHCHGVLQVEREGPEYLEALVVLVELVG